MKNELKYLASIFAIGLATVGCNQAVNSGARQGAANQQGQQVQESNEGSSVGQWASSTWNGAVEGGSNAVEGTQDWLNNLFQSAKDQGTTTANSVKEWVADDWNAQGDFQYKIVTLGADDPAAVEAKLNELGGQRWDCYHVASSGPTWTFFLKRTRRSYLSRIPLKDLANLLPATAADGE